MVLGEVSQCGVMCVWGGGGGGCCYTGSTCICWSGCRCSFKPKISNALMLTQIIVSLSCMAKI